MKDEWSSLGRPRLSGFILHTSDILSPLTARTLRLRKRNSGCLPHPGGFLLEGFFVSLRMTAPCRPHCKIAFGADDMTTLQEEQLTSATGHVFLHRPLAEVDPQIADAIKMETDRQNDTL